MSSKHLEIQLSRKKLLGMGLLACLIAAAPAALAQYPAGPQVKKDGTAVVLQDYLTPPLSSPTHGGATSTGIDYKGQLARVNSMRAEPANAPLAASHVFVDDMNGTLYILDTDTKKLTPYLKFADIFPKFASDKGNASGIVSITFDPG